MATSPHTIGNKSGNKVRTGPINPEDLTNPEFVRSDENAKAHVQARYRNMYDYKLRYTQRNNVHYEQYRGYNKPVTFPFHSTYRSNINVPYAFATVEQVVPRIVKGCLNDGYNFFDLRPREKVDRKNADQHKKLLKWQIERMNFYIEFTMMVKTAAMFGYCCAKVDWVFQTGSRKFLRVNPKYAGMDISEEIRKKYGHALYEEMVEDNHIIYDNNRFTCMDWDEAYPDEAARYTLHTGRDFIHSRKVTLRELHERKRPDGKPLYTNLDKISVKKGYTAEDSDQDRRLSAIGASKNVWRQQSQMQHDKAEQEVVLWEYWTPRYVVTIANQSQCIRRDFNYFWHGMIPVVDLNYTYVPNELFGIGAIESFRDLQTALNTITNMDLDNWSMQVNQMHIVDRRADIPQRQLVSRPWGVVYSSIPPKDAVMPIQKQSISRDTSIKQQEMRANIMLASGLSDMHYMGTSAGSRVGRTATGVMQTEQQANIRYEMSIQLAEFMTLNPTFKMMTSNNQQFIRTPKWVQIVGEADERKPPELVKPEDIWDGVDIIFRGAQRISKQQVEQHQMANFIQSIGSNQIFMAHLKPRPLLREALRRFFEVDPEEFMMPEPQDVLSPQEENQLMMYGQEVIPDVGENFLEHLQAHMMIQSHESFAAWRPEAQYVMTQHVERTIELAQMVGTPGSVSMPTGEAGAAGSSGAMLREAGGLGNEPPGPTNPEMGPMGL